MITYSTGGDAMSTSNTRFHLVTEWDLAAPLAAVWGVLVAPEDWPSWWRAVKKVELIDPGSPNGIGAYRRLTWKTALPYDVTFNMRTTRVEPPAVIEGRADGELDGTGRWTLTPTASGTHVRYDWIVDVTKPWMRVFAPILRPVFAWNHNVVMEWGREGIVRRLAGAAKPAAMAAR
jgi:uncharacterized protein YndB with AHSA1/START domain